MMLYKKLQGPGVIVSTKTQFKNDQCTIDFVSPQQVGLFLSFYVPYTVLIIASAKNFYYDAYVKMILPGLADSGCHAYFDLEGARVETDTYLDKLQPCSTESHQLDILEKLNYKEDHIKNV
jgi:hypothetical protein